MALAVGGARAREDTASHSLCRSCSIELARRSSNPNPKVVMHRLAL